MRKSSLFITLLASIMTLASCVNNSSSSSFSTSTSSSTSSSSSSSSTTLSSTSTSTSSTTITSSSSSSSSTSSTSSSQQIVSVSSVSLSEKTLTLDVGDNHILTANVLPSNATYKSVSWSTSDSSVASVNDGLVNAISKGSATITVTTNDGGFTDSCLVTVNEIEQEIDVNFTVSNVEYINATTDKQKAKVGDDVTISINSIKDGYDLTSFILKDSDSNEITYTKVIGSDNKYTYQQTADGVCVLEGEIKGKDIKGYVSDDHLLISSNPEMSIDDGKTYQEVAPAGVEEGRTYYNFTYGAKIIFHLQDNETYKANGLNVDGVSYQVDNAGAVYFDAIIDDFEYFFMDIVVEDEYLKPLGGEYEFAYVNSEHISIKTYKSDKKTEIIGADQNDIVYIHADGVNDDYSVREIVISAPSSDLGSPATTTATKIDNEWFSFKTPFSYNSIVTITVIEANNKILKGCEGVGSYLCLWISSATHSFNAFDKQTFVIMEDGTFTMKYNESTTKSDIFVSDDGEFLTTQSTSAYKIPYGNNFAFIGNNIDNGIDAPYGAYSILGIKKADPDDVETMYEVHGEKFNDENENAYVSIQVSRNGENYANAFIDLNKKISYFGVKFNLLQGEKVNDDIVLYEVFDENGDKLCVIGSNGQGGYLARCILDKHYGTYTKDEDKLVILNSSKATFNDESYSYSIQDDTITLKSSTREMVLTLDATNRTYTVISDTSLHLDLPEFAGKKFRSGAWDFEDDISYYAFYIEFSATDFKMSTAGGCDMNLDMEHHTTQAFAVNENVDYTYDKANQIVTANIVVKGGKIKNVQFTYKDGSFYVNATDLGSNFYSGTKKLSEI